MSLGEGKQRETQTGPHMALQARVQRRSVGGWPGADTVRVPMHCSCSASGQAVPHPTSTNVGVTSQCRLPWRKRLSAAWVWGAAAQGALCGTSAMTEFLATLVGSA